MSVPKSNVLSCSRSFLAKSDLGYCSPKQSQNVNVVVAREAFSDVKYWKPISFLVLGLKYEKYNYKDIGCGVILNFLSPIALFCEGSLSHLCGYLNAKPLVDMHGSFGSTSKFVYTSSIARSEVVVLNCFSLVYINISL